MNNFDQRINNLYFNNLIENELLEEGVMDDIKRWAAVTAISLPLMVGMFKMGQVTYDVLSKDPKSMSKVELDNIVDEFRSLASQQSSTNNTITPNPPTLDTVADTPDATFEQYKERISAEEGYRNRVYNDSKGLRTIGIGHLITSDDNRLFMNLFGRDVNYRNVITGKQDLTNDQVDILFRHDLLGKISNARTAITKFDDLPDYVQIAIVDGYFRGDLPGSPKALGHINADNWDKVADEYRDNEEYRDSKALGERHGVWQRMDRNAEAYETYSDSLKSKKNK